MPNTTPLKTILTVEGNIGAGKSTLLRILERHLPVDIVFEPTDKWQKINACDNLLKLFYNDTSRWAYTFQSYAFISRIQAQVTSLQRNPEKTIQIIERSVYCDRYCFAQNCHESGTMNKLEWEIYKEWFEWLIGNYSFTPRGFIYLKTHPEVCYQRLKKRNRSEESGVPLSYLQTIHQKHEDWLINQKDLNHSLPKIPVLTIECDKDFEDNKARQKSIIASINTFIENINGSVAPLIPPRDQNISTSL